MWSREYWSSIIILLEFPQRQHGAKTILKAMDEADHILKCFWETSHRSQQWWQSVQHFSPSWVFRVFCFFFALLGLTKNWTITYYLKDSTWTSASLAKDEWLITWTNVQTIRIKAPFFGRKKKSWKYFTCWLTVDDVRMKSTSVTQRDCIGTNPIFKNVGTLSWNCSKI